MKNMKGQLEFGIVGSVMMLVVIGIFIIIGATMMESFENDQSANINQTAQNVSLGILEIGENMELLGLIVIMGIVIAVLIGSFGGFISGGV